MKELIEALIKARLAFDPISKDGEGIYGHYTTLDEIIHATDKALAENGLLIVHNTEIKEGKSCLVTKLYHAPSGLFLPSESIIEDYIKPDGRITPVQAYGGIITYLKRYHMAQLLNIATDEDIDGADGKAGDKGKPTAQKPKQDADKPPEQPEKHTDYQKKAFALSANLLMTEPEMKADVALLYKHESRKDMSDMEWQDYCKVLGDYKTMSITPESLDILKTTLEDTFKTYYPAGIDDPKLVVDINKKLKEADKDHRSMLTPKAMYEWQAKFIIRQIQKPKKTEDA